MRAMNQLPIRPITGGLLLVALVTVAVSAAGSISAPSSVELAFTRIIHVEGTLPIDTGYRRGPFIFYVMEIWLDSASPEPGLNVGYQRADLPVIYTWYIHPGERVIVKQYPPTHSYYAWYINIHPNTQTVTFTGKIALTG